MTLSRRLLAPMALVFPLAACNGAVTETAPTAPAAPAAPTTQGSCTTLGDAPADLVDEAPASTLASDGTHLFFLRRGSEGRYESLVRQPIGGGPTEIVSALTAGKGFGGELAAAPARVAFTRGNEVPHSYFGTVVETREVLVLEAGASAPFVAYTVGNGEHVGGLSMTPAGDVYFHVQSEERSTLHRWRAGTTELIGEVPNGAATLADASGAFVALHAQPRGDVAGTPSIARIEGPGGALETFLSFERSRKISGLHLMGSDASSLYFMPSSGTEGMNLRRVPRTGGIDEPVLQGAWSFSQVIVDDQPSLVIVGTDVIFRQPKDGTQRTTLVVDTGRIGTATADACNVYWSTFDPPRIRGRSR